jgi:predicted membrane-bound spermidine synthase
MVTDLCGICVRDEHILELAKQCDAMISVMKKALDAWELDHLSRDPIDWLKEAIEKHEVQ